MMTFLLLLSATVVPSVPAIVRMIPVAAGELLLKGHEHGPIARIASPPVDGHLPTSVHQLDLFEHASKRPGGCVRRKWTVTLDKGERTATEATVVSSPYATTEVAVPHRSGCDAAAFVHFDGSLEIDEALAALRFLDDVRRARTTVRFSCRDLTGSGLCESKVRILRQLARDRPWAVMRRLDTTVMWLGRRGQAVTEISYVEPRAGRMTIERRIPAPF